MGSVAKQPTRHPRPRQSIHHCDLYLSANMASNLSADVLLPLALLAPVCQELFPHEDIYITQSSTWGNPEFLVVTREMPQVVLMLMSCSRE